MHRTFRTLAFVGVAFVGVLLARAQQPARPPINHDFDFWIGDWNVTDREGKLVGTNRVERVSGGYGLLENWAATEAGGGGTGKSLNAYNQATKHWQQFWIGGGGGVLELSGGLDPAGQMVLSGSRDVPGKGALTNRIRWTPNADGSVRQVWEQSTDGGATWKVVFDGLYRRKS